MPKTIYIENNRVCLFCGEIIQKRYDDCQEYYECDCKDAKYNKGIDNKINALKNKYKKHKFEIVKAIKKRTL